MNGSTPKAPGAQPPAGSSFRVRSARRGDAEAIRSLLAELGFSDAADPQTLNWIISHPEMEVLVAADSLDKPIGVLTMSHRPQLRLKGRIVTVDELVVTQAWRRKGVGKELLRRALERAKVLSARRFEVASRCGTPEGASFLAACGLARQDSLLFSTTELERK